LETEANAKENEMSDIQLSPLSGDGGLITAATPRTFTGTFTAEEMSFCYVIVYVTSVSGGINAGNPATITWETSFDNGLSWKEIVGYTKDPITAAGEFFAFLNANLNILGPICRVRVAAPGGQSLVVDKVVKSRVTDLVVLRSAAGGGGGGGAAGDIIGAGGAAPYTSGAAVQAQAVIAYLVGYNGATHTEVRLNANGNLVAESVPKNVIEDVFQDYSITPVTTLAWVQIVAATAAKIEWMDIFDSSGQTLEIARGGAGAEVRIGYILPGGCRIYEEIAAGTRLSVRAVSADANAGTLVINAFG
jgi:hypothetical protein